MRKEVKLTEQNLHSEETKKLRRKIEDKMRKELTESQIVGLANLLQIDTSITKKQEKN